VLPNVHLYQVFSLHFLRSQPNLLSFLPLVLVSRFIKYGSLYCQSTSDRPYLNPKVRRLILLYLFVQLQLQQLMDTLNLTEPHYIRCVKPNTQLKPFIFEHMNVIQQLRSGVSLIKN